MYITVYKGGAKLVAIAIEKQVIVDMTTGNGNCVAHNVNRVPQVGLGGVSSEQLSRIQNYASTHEIIRP